MRLLALAFELKSGAAVAAILNVGIADLGEDFEDVFDPSSAADLRLFVELLAWVAGWEKAPVAIPEQGGVAAPCYKLVSKLLQAAGVEVVQKGLPAAGNEAMPHVESDVAATMRWFVIVEKDGPPQIKAARSAFAAVREHKVQLAQPRELGRGLPDRQRG